MAHRVGATKFFRQGGTGAASLALAFAFLSMVAVFIPAGDARAQNADVYTVSGVAVSGRGGTADQAKARAVAAGRAEALQQLLKRLTLQKDHARLPRPGDETIRAALLGFEVQKENLAATAYRGRITYSFKRAAVQQILQDAAIPFVQGNARPVLMLAVWHDGRAQASAMVLWDEPNPWRSAWDATSLDDSALSFVRADGDLSDLQAISAESAVRMDPAALGKIAAKYRAGVVLVSYARPSGKLVRINVRGFNAAAGRIFQVGNFTGQNSKAGLGVAAERIAAAYEAQWKEANLITDTATGTLVASAPLSGYAYWVRLRDGLASVPFIRKYRVLNLSPAEAKLELTHVGTQARLATALREANIILENGPLSDTGEATWRLRLAGTPVPTAPETRTPENSTPAPPPSARVAPGAPAPNSAGPGRVEPLVPLLPAPGAPARPATE